MQQRTITWDAGRGRTVTILHVRPGAWWWDVCEGETIVDSGTALSFYAVTSQVASGLALTGDEVRRELVPLHCYALLDG
jgi:hypothetical protein